MSGTYGIPPTCGEIVVMVTGTSLTITGYRDRPVPNRLRQPSGAIGRLAMMLPGFGYTMDMPLFYYLENLCLDLGLDVLRVETSYSQNPAFREATKPEQAEWVAADARAAWQRGLAHASYASTIVIGKSLGTLGLAALMTQPVNAPEHMQSIWLTPLLAEPSVRQALQHCGNTAQVVIGDADPHYDAAVIAELEASGTHVVVAQSAEHGLDIEGDAVASAQLLVQLITAMRDFGFRKD